MGLIVYSRVIGGGEGKRESESLVEEESGLEWREKEDVCK